MPEGSSPENPHSPMTPGERVRQTRKAITSRFPNAEQTLKKKGLHRKLSEKDFNLAKIGVAANLVREADTDITGIYNKTGFLKRAHMEADVLRRLKQPATLAFVDLNGLKAINDANGHDAGDEYLQRSVNVLRNTTRDADIVGRYGGDELCAILVGTDVTRAATWLRHFKAQMDADQVNASVGLASFNPDDVVGTIKRADRMMYDAKRAYYKERAGDQRTK